MRQIQPPHESAQARIVIDVIEELGEDGRMGNRNVLIQRVDGCDMDRLGCQETCDEIHVPRSVAGRWEV